MIQVAFVNLIFVNEKKDSCLLHMLFFHKKYYANNRNMYTIIRMNIQCFNKSVVLDFQIICIGKEN